MGIGKPHATGATEVTPRKRVKVPTKATQVADVDLRHCRSEDTRSVKGHREVRSHVDCDGRGHEEGPEQAPSQGQGWVARDPFC